ncbi:MAG: MCE family protein [Planctomycetes bacterium]|nr:MCE family protein [Planctomycetota bacterium]
MERTRRDTLLGLVFFCTLAFLLWATVNLTDMSLGQAPPLEVWFADAGGAQVGTNVYVLGKRIGKVGKIDVIYDDERPTTPIRMELLIEEQIPLTDEMKIEVRADGVLGGKLVYIDPGRGVRIAPETELLGNVQRNVFDAFTDLAEGQGPVGSNFNAMVTAIREAALALRDKENTVGALLTTRELYVEVLQTVQSLRSILETIAEGESTFGRLAVDTAMGERVQYLIDNLATASETLTRSEGTVGMLLNDPGTASNVRQIVADVAAMIADARAGKGLVGRLLRDDELADQVGEAIAAFNAVLANANDPEAGLIGAAFADPVTGEHFKIAVANIRDVTDRLTQGEGALGILINDRDVGVRLRRIFTQVSRALEDAREAAPISSFVQVLLGVF